MEGKEHCPSDIYNYLEGWEKAEILQTSIKHQAFTTQPQLTDQSEIIATLTAQNKLLKRKVGDIDFCLGRTEKTQRSNSGNYKMVADNANQDEM